MAKGYWIGRVDVHNDEGYKPYAAANAAIFKKFGGRFVVRAGKFSGVEGHSLNAWDAERACWHQTWLDSGGGVLLLDGGVVDGAMVLEGVDADARQRITWAVEGDGGRQLWESSTDDGQSWSVAFDGRYRRS